jgi:hypothetical protein
MSFSDSLLRVNNGTTTDCSVRIEDSQELFLNLHHLQNILVLLIRVFRWQLMSMGQ